MKTKKFLSNTTNSKLPNDQLSRIFIGNVNTNQTSKKHILKLFNKYGQIKAISMHKGYAFVQYFNKEHAQLAIQKMHGQLIGGQLIVTDPKPYQKKLTIEEKQENESNLEESKKLSTEVSSIKSTQKSNESSIKLAISKPSLNKSTSKKLPVKSPQSTKLPYLNQFESIMSTIYEQYALSNLYQPINLPVNSTKQHSQINSDVLICGICKSIFYDFNLFAQHKQLCIYATSKLYS